MSRKSIVAIVVILILGVSSAAVARFVGPSVSGRDRTVEQVSSMRVGSYITLTGHIIEHQRNDFFTFQDDTGTIRVEIANNVWRNQDVSPETKVQIFGEVDRGLFGRYIWVEALTILP